MAQAMAAGVPQLVMPMSQDQPDNAARIRHLGAGEVLVPEKFTTKNLANKLASLLHDNKIKQNCLDLSKKIDFELALRQTCDLLENGEG